MVNDEKFAVLAARAVLCILLVSGTCWGADEVNVFPVGANTVDEDMIAEEPVMLEEELTVVPLEPRSVADLHAGYRFLTVNRAGSRAGQYEDLRSGATLHAMAGYLSRETKFSLDGGYLTDKDYHGKLSYDYNGMLRFTLLTESMVHNLDHEQLGQPFVTHNSSTNTDNYYLFNDMDPRAKYRLRFEQDTARLRYRFTSLPVHLNLGYWRLLKEGATQLIFADQAFEGTPNVIYSRTRRVDRQTHEGTFGFDSHLGLFDLIYEFKIRQFNEQTATPADVTFISRTDPALVMGSNGGVLEHNANPDSRFTAHTFRLHTAMSGGIVGAASYTYARRENFSQLADFGGADQVLNAIHNFAGDFSYTPCHIFSMALKYRRQDVERSGPATLTNQAGIASNPPVEVRTPLDTLKDVVTATFSYRPSTFLTLKGEYKGEFLSREQMEQWQQPGITSTLYYPRNSATHTGSIALYSRPLKGLKLKAEYLYSTSDNPGYAIGYEEKHVGTAQLSFNAPNRWGVTASARFARENSDHLAISTLNLGNPVTTYELPRNRNAGNATVALWVVPYCGLTVTGSYGILRSSSDQAVLFASTTPGSTALTNYTSQAQMYGVNATYHWNERLDLALALQQIRSFAQFDPQYINIGQNRDTSGITELSRLTSVESSLAARADYRLSRNFSCALQYAFRDYDEKTDASLSGSVNSILLSLAAKW